MVLHGMLLIAEQFGVGILVAAQVGESEMLPLAVVVGERSGTGSTVVVPTVVTETEKDDIQMEEGEINKEDLRVVLLWRLDRRRAGVDLTALLLPLSLSLSDILALVVFAGLDVATQSHDLRVVVVDFLLEGLDLGFSGGRDPLEGVDNPLVVHIGL